MTQIWMRFPGVLCLSVKRFDGVDHSDNVFDWGVHLHVVDAVEDESAVWRENCAALKHLLVYLIGRAKGQGFLGIDTATPEDDAVAITIFKDLGIHAGGGTLNRIENVEARVDEVWNEGFDCAA